MFYLKEVYNQYNKKKIKELFCQEKKGFDNFLSSFTLPSV